MNWNQKHYCKGCWNNYYHRAGRLVRDKLGREIRECWELRDAKIIWRQAVPMKVPISESYKYKKRRLPSCYHSHEYYFPVHDKVPE